MSEKSQRRLAAIVCADVVGYSRLMGADETGTLSALNSHRSELIDPLVAKHGGRIVKTMGDGLLLEFPSVVAAVECVIAAQTGLAERNADIAADQAIQFRVGVHLGDVIVEGDDIFGDGVNVAARLEGLSEANGVALSDDAYRQVRDRIDADWEDSGEHEVKNIARPVHVWRWSAQERQPVQGTEVTSEALALPDKPSIAVLPFDNMSGDPEQEFFADGITEDVITALSHFRSLFVIARNSSFSYKGNSPDIRLVARELGVRYVVEGSVRKAGNRVRITAQLIDAASGNHLWANRFDGSLDDVFDLQDQITEQIVIVVEPEILARERERARRLPPESLDTWEVLQRGLSHFYRMNKTDIGEAIRLIREATSLDPSFAAAHAHLAYVQWVSAMAGYADDREKALASARAAAKQAASLDANEPLAHLVLGRLFTHVGEIEMAIGEMQGAINLNPNFAWAYFSLGMTYLNGAAQPEQALPHLDAALRLSPRDPLRFGILMFKGSALRILGRYDEAIAHCRQACQFPDAGYLPYMHLAASLGDAGQMEEAQAAVENVKDRHPEFSISNLQENFAGLNESYLSNLSDSLRKAGVPD